MAAVCWRVSKLQHFSVLTSARRFCIKKSTASSDSFVPTAAEVNNEHIQLHLGDEAHKIQELRKSDEKNDTDLKTKILEASLLFVNDNGWTRTTLGRGAESIGIPGVAHGMFPKGGIELIQYFYNDCNKKLVYQMEQDTIGHTLIANPSEFVHSSVKTRLIMIKPYMSQWPQAIAIMSLPPNVPTSLAQLLTLVDDICYYAGDRSVDIQWYSRRVALAGIFKMTELYMLQDKSPNHEKTWEFLNRRIQDVTQLHNVLVPSEKLASQATEAISSAFVTARNMLGLNWNRE